MKQQLIAFLLLLCPTILCGQHNSEQPFKGYIYNNVYNIYIKMNIYDNDVTVPGHDIYGELPGFIGKKNNSYSWMIINTKIKNKHQAELTIINDTGSEDLKAMLTMKNDSTFVLKQTSGSTLKVPNNGKWQKLPTEIVFIRKHQ